ncbi:hypothetical protein PRIPAC_78746 [Pristionchus pacificus]|uniref:Uncharacterized protein n=1 Tax=Pristionchus pacificus TaxID=54126 RepID=A0A2A6C4F0_PRIPA|nr:hypothetical protein PRIPAC_78746 [Pristionchus pacificus]|eukprot:PDM72923.1 hypothetical protein PRIPAC_39357 [Pristionchus pacificus]
MRLFLASLLFFAALAFDVEGQSTASVSVTKDGQETSMTVNGEGSVGASLAENSDGTIDASTVNEGIPTKRVFAAHSSAFKYSFASSVMVIALTRVL